MDIGIIGKGKMGRDIFDYISKYDHRLVLICRNAQDIDRIEESVVKQLNKMLKRGLLTDKEYEAKKQSFTISSELSDLRNCDIVIEAVYEDRELKKSIFNELESIVKPDCILATNTSSIPLNVVFENCTIKQRCLGTHFFYPVKVNSYVEVDKTDLTEQRHVNTVTDLLFGIDKKPLVLEEKDNLILTKVLTTVVAEIYEIYRENHLSIQDIEKLVKEKFLTFGGFEMIDSTGLNIYVQIVENFTSDRYRKLYTNVHNSARAALNEGFSGGSSNKGLAAYELEHSTELLQLSDNMVEAYKHNVLLRLQSLLVNEIAFIISTTGLDKQQINDAAKEIIGLQEDPSSMLKRIGRQKIEECLLDSYKGKNDDIYCPMNLSILE